LAAIFFFVMTLLRCLFCPSLFDNPATNDDYVAKIKQRRAEQTTKERHDKEEDRRQAANVLRDLGEKLSKDDVLLLDLWNEPVPIQTNANFFLRAR
jgi:hypothetical protein